MLGKTAHLKVVFKYESLYPNQTFTHFFSIIIFIHIDNIFMEFISHPAQKFPVSD